MEHEALTGAIIGAAIAVHRVLGPGFVEGIYENALAIELGNRGIPFARQVNVEVPFSGECVGLHRLDLLVADEIVVELKAVTEVPDISFAMVRSYLRATGVRHALILDFAKLKLEVKRVFAMRRV